MWSVEGKVDQQKRKGVCGGGWGGVYHLRVVKWTGPYVEHPGLLEIVNTPNLF